MFLRAPDRFRRVREPNGTIWTTFGLPAGPAGPARAGSEFCSVGGHEKKIPQELFCSKTIFIGSWLGFGPKKLILDPLDPPKGAILAHFTHKMAKMGFKNGPKTHFFHKKNLL